MRIALTSGRVLRRRVPSVDSQRVQATRRSRLPHRGGVEARRTGEVDPAWASFHSALVVGAKAAGFVASGIAGVAAAGSMRSALSGYVQGESARCPWRSAAAANQRRGATQGAALVHRCVRELGHGGAFDLHAGGPESCNGGAWRRGAVRGGPVRRWWIDPVGGAASRMRGVRQRPEPSGMPHSQGHAGGHPAPRSGAGR